MLKLKNRFIYPLVLTLSLGVFSGTSLKADEIDSHFFGELIGITFGAVQAGFSFEEALVHLKIDEKGLLATRRQDGSDIQILYPPEWLFKMPANGDFPDGLAIKQRVDGPLAASIFLFDNTQGLQVLEILGEGIPAPLAIYIANEAGAEAKLREKYSELKEGYRQLGVAGDGRPENYLMALFENDMANLQASDVSLDRKEEILDRVSFNLSTGSPDEIAERMKFFEYAILESGDLGVATAALDKASLDIRIPEMVPLVIAGLGRAFREKNVAMLNNASRGVMVQLYEAYNYLSKFEKFFREFGSLDLETILKTRGPFSPEQVEILEQFSRVGEIHSKNYSYAQLVQLRETLNLLMARTLDAKWIPDRWNTLMAPAATALEEHPDNFTCIASLKALSN